MRFWPDQGGQMLWQLPGTWLLRVLTRMVLVAEAVCVVLCQAVLCRPCCKV